MLAATLLLRSAPRASRHLAVFAQSARNAHSRASEASLTDEGFKVTEDHMPGGDYRVPRVTYGWLTVNAGERVGIWKPNGTFRTVDGPQRLVLCGSKVQRLQQHIANPSEFLRILKTDGTKEYRYGPCSVWEDPLTHVEVRTLQALTLNANEAMVVYRESGGNVSRRVIRGPAVQMPQENEWIHKFSWHGKDNNAPPLVNRKKPAQLQFTKLVTIPDQLYFDVEGVRTADDAVLSVKVMVFFELVDIEKMLDSTSDPPSDIINTLSADVIEWTSSRSFASFKSSSERLNTLEAYPQLLKRAKEIGFKISKMVFRGYSTSTKLEGMHDAAIEARTQLTLQQETEAMSQHLADFKLTQAALRAQKERAMELEDATHKHALEATKRNEAIKAERETAAAKQEIQIQAAANALSQSKKIQEAEQKHIASLVNMGLDVTRYFEAKESRNVKVLKFEGSQHGKKPKIDLHHHEKVD